MIKSFFVAILLVPALNSFTVIRNARSVIPINVPSKINTITATITRDGNAMGGGGYSRVFANPRRRASRFVLSSASGDDEVTGGEAVATSEPDKGGLLFLLDVNTKGGALFYSVVLFVVPIIFYVYECNTSSKPPEEIGRNIGFAFTTGLTLLWTSTYLFRVANKDMTYAKQLKDYEDGVIQRRLEELDDDEREGLLEEIEREEDRF